MGLQLHGVTFKKRAPRAIKEIKKFATQSMVRSPNIVSFGVRQYLDSRLHTMTQSQMRRRRGEANRNRAPPTSVLTRNSTRRSGRPASRASPTGCAFASHESVTMRKALLKSCTATFRPSMSRARRACRLLWLRTHRYSYRRGDDGIWIAWSGGVIAFGGWLYDG